MNVYNVQCTYKVTCWGSWCRTKPAMVRIMTAVVMLLLLLLLFLLTQLLLQFPQVWFFHQFPEIQIKRLGNEEPAAEICVSKDDLAL